MVLSIILALISQCSFAQFSSERDSLYHQINHARNDSAKAWNILQLGLYFERIDIDSSKFWFSEAIRLTNDHVGDDTYANIQGVAHLRLAIVDIKSGGEQREILLQLNSAKQLFEQADSKARIADVLTTMGIYEYLNHMQEQAIAHHLEAIDIIKEINDTIRLAMSYNNLGLAYSNTNQLEEAISIYQEAITLNEATHHMLENGRLYGNIGKIYSELGYHQKAKEYFKKSLTLKKEFGTKGEYAGALNNLGAPYRDLGESDSAIIFFQKAKDISSEINDIEVLLLSTNNLGLLYSDKGEFKQAAVYLSEALGLSREYGTIPQVILTLSNLAMAMTGLENYEKAIDLSLEGVALCDSIGTERPKIELYHNLSEAYTKKGMLNEAMEFFKLKVSIKDSLNSTEQKEALLRIENEFQLAKQAGEIQRQKNELLQNEAQAELQQTRIAVLIVGLSLTFLLSLFLYRGYRSKTSKNHDLETKNRLILEQKDQIEAQRKKLEELNRNKDKLFSIISHDLRGPFNSLRMLLEVSNSGDLNEQQISVLLAKLNDSVGANYGFIENLLEWSRSQQGGLSVDKSTFELRSLFINKTELFKQQISNKEICVENNVPESLKMNSDPNLIRLVLRNLIGNSIKFSQKHGTIKFDAELEDGWVKVSVADNGVGISDDLIPGIFVLANKSTRGTDNEVGTGLGLTLCKEVVSLLGGEISASSQKGKGSTFTFKLPV